MSKKNIYEQAYNSCIKKGLIQSKCAKFLKLDFELKLKKCRTSKYKSKLKSLKRKSKSGSIRKRSSSKSRRKRRRSIKTKKDGFVVEFPVKPYNTCYTWKGF